MPAPPAIAGRPLQAVIDGRRPRAARRSRRSATAATWPTACARGKDKYVRRFSPDEDELYFDLAGDPKEKPNRVEENRERVRLLRAGVEAAMVPNPFRHTLRVEGAARTCCG